MRANEAVRTVMEQKDIGVSVVAKRMGKTMRLVCDRLSMENISVDKLNDMLRVLDYKIVLMPSDAPTPKGGFEIE